MARTRLVILNAVDVESLDAQQRSPPDLRSGIYSTEPCSTCGGTCCATAPVEITTVEALRIAYARRLSLSAVAQRVDVPRGMEARMAAHVIPLDDGNTVLRVRRGNDGRCVFLQRVLEQGRCAIHDARPGLCRMYPLRFSVGEETLEVGDQMLCPSRWLKTRELEDALARDHRRWRRDLALEKRLIGEWGRAGGAQKPWSAYVEFSMRFVEARWGVTLPQVRLHQPRRRWR